MSYTSVNRNAATVAPPSSPWLDEALGWFEDATARSDPDASAAFVRLDPHAQILALDIVRSSLRAALRLGDVEPWVFALATSDRYRVWFSAREQ